jgi:hypothetical protein
MSAGILDETGINTISHNWESVKLLAVGILFPFTFIVVMAFALWLSPVCPPV